MIALLVDLHPLAGPVQFSAFVGAVALVFGATAHEIRHRERR